MSRLDMLKRINKKWLILLAVVLIVGIIGSIVANIWVQRKHSGTKTDKVVVQVSREVMLDFLYLEQFDSLKLSPEQAREILPLADSLVTSDSSLQVEQAKQIYGMLTPLQYQALDNRQEVSNEAPRDYKKNRKLKGFDSRRGLQIAYGKQVSKLSLKKFQNFQNIREEALSNVIINMLKARGSEKPAAQAQPQFQAQPQAQTP